jgi:type IV pilus assembly protein PilC
MPLFSYTAKKEDGTIQKATVDAPDRFSVYEIVRKNGLEILTLEEGKNKKIKGGDILGKFRRIKKMEIILFLKNTGSMLNAGLALPRSLQVMIRQTKNERFKSILQDILKDLEQGSTFSSGLAKNGKIFSPLVIAMVQAGEESGTLATTLKTIALQLERTLQLQKRIKGAMMYPSIIIGALFLVGAIMMIYIVPSLTETFKEMGTELPASTQFIIALSDFLVENTFLAFFLVIFFITSFVFLIRTPLGKRYFEIFTLHIPVIKDIIKETNSARTARTLSSLLTSGVHMVEAIKITENVVQNSFYKEIILEARKNVEEGKQLATVFMNAEKFYPPLVGELIAVGEETGALPDMLKEVAHYYEREVTEKTKNISTIIEPVLMLVVGGGVGFFAVSMISPIYNISM